MADLKYYDIILRPIVTEKSMRLQEGNVYTFDVHPDATKTQVKEAVEKMFEGTKVLAVNTINVPGKKKRRNTKAGLVIGYTPKRKKAMVKLDPDGKQINLYEGL